MFDIYSKIKIGDYVVSTDIIIDRKYVMDVRGTLAQVSYYPIADCKVLYTQRVIDVFPANLHNMYDRNIRLDDSCYYSPDDLVIVSDMTAVDDSIELERLRKLFRKRMEVCDDYTGEKEFLLQGFLAHKRKQKVYNLFA